MKNIITICILMLCFVNCHSAELELPGWEKKVTNDVLEQKILNYSIEYKIGDRVFKSYINQVRNDTAWHWSQVIGIVEAGKFNKITWNVVLGDGPMVQRWYSGSMPKGISYIVLGEAEKDGYKGSNLGEKFLQICCAPSDSTTDADSVLFIANAKGIYEPRFVGGDKEKVKF